ncbi:uncharacterized protein LOC132698461 isoform X2 [Cylas formicarius]|uniref:uncharacterized protein LOC132698461 isoform X2 n=1 Tax=Cylas formicarius TaxID=197179 RepID=UPI0029584E28|nr:uncharacterized protein LOC132698461 isoform X2 [Cylas formicarius]
MCSCCEDEYYEVSCSVEERIDRELWESNEKERRDRDILNDLRQRNYQQVYSSKTSKVFGLPGLQFVRFTHLSVKFSFVPSLLFEMISKRIVLYISLRYLPRYNKWILRREPLPADRRFHFNKFFCNTRIDDMKLNTVIFVIYLRLKKWSIELADFNKKKKKGKRDGVSKETTPMGSKIMYYYVDRL